MSNKSNSKDKSLGKRVLDFFLTLYKRDTTKNYLKKTVVKLIFYYIIWVALTFVSNGNILIIVLGGVILIYTYCRIVYLLGSTYKETKNVLYLIAGIILSLPSFLILLIALYLGYTKFSVGELVLKK